MNGARIMLVDDNVEFSVMVCDFLRQSGFEVSCFAAPDVALGALESGRKFELIISDLKMEPMDGFEFYSQIRERRIHTPFLLVSGYLSEEYEQKAKRLGIVNVFKKPFEVKDFIGVLSKLIQVKLT